MSAADLGDRHQVSDDDVEKRIEEFFELNYVQMRQEGGHVLAEGAKRQALEQALHYWRKLKGIAKAVTDTEVKLSLPGQVTPKGRRFVIEGVVDIVRDGDTVWMYDLKTHEDRDVRAQRHVYEDQLNVYAHIWKGISGRRLDGTSVIATRLPEGLREALRRGDIQAIRAAMDAWQPVVDLQYDDEHLRHTIDDFARCVDEIEDGVFSPPPVEKLDEVSGTGKRSPDDVASGGARGATATFARRHCSNCDARFTCKPYRRYDARQQAASRGMKRPAVQIENDERELDAWIEENLAEE